MSGPKLFRHNYTIRRYKEQQNIDGYAYAQYEDFEVSLNVQPQSPDSISTNGEGERRVKRLKAYGDFSFTAADQTRGQRGDFLLYKGVWYECMSALDWDHTILCHNKAEFVEIPASELSDDLTEDIASAERGDFYGFR